MIKQISNLTRNNLELHLGPSMMVNTKLHIKKMSRCNILTDANAVATWNMTGFQKKLCTRSSVLYSNSALFEEFECWRNKQQDMATLIWFKSENQTKLSAQDPSKQQNMNTTSSSVFPETDLTGGSSCEQALTDVAKDARVWFIGSGLSLFSGALHYQAFPINARGLQWLESFRVPCFSKQKPPG